MAVEPVYYFARMVPGYRIPVLEELNQKLDGRLIVCSGQPPKGSSHATLAPESECAFQTVKLRNRWFFGESVHLQPFRCVFEQFGDPAVVLAEESPHSVSLPFLLRHARMHGGGRVLWGHFSSLDRPFDPGKHAWDRYRLAMARHVEACACYTDGIAAMLRSEIPDEKLFVARNTIDLSPLLAQYDELEKQGKAAIREQLSFPREAPVLIFVGRLVAEKGTKVLLDTFARLQRGGPATLVIIGDGPERSAMEAFTAKNDLSGVHFLGPLSIGDPRAAPYLYAADLMLMPGALGLVINHSFAFGLPVVSFRHPVGSAKHGPEIEYIRSGENGLLCAGNTSEELSNCVRSALEKVDRYSSNAQKFARKSLTLESMVEGLYDAIAHAAAQRIDRRRRAWKLNA